MLEICGPPLYELSDLSNQDGASWRMCQDFLHLDITDESLMTWPRAGMIVDGVCSELTMSVQTMNGKGCGWYPTPDASMGMRGHSDPEKRKSKNQKINLNDVIGGQPNPPWIEWLMGIIPGWTSLNPLRYDDLIEWRLSYENQEYRASGSTEEISSSRKVRDMSREEGQGQTSQRQKSTEQRKIKHPVSMSEMPHSSPYDDRGLGQGQSQEKEMCDMQQAVSARAEQSRGAMQEENMQEKDRLNQFSKEMERTQQRKTMPLVPEDIHIQEGKREDLFSVLWKLPVLEQAWWGLDPADVGIITRVSTGVKNRVNRLKGIGNGQVPLAAAEAFRILTEDISA